MIRQAVAIAVVLTLPLSACSEKEAGTGSAPEQSTELKSGLDSIEIHGPAEFAIVDLDELGVMYREQLESIQAVLDTVTDADSAARARPLLVRLARTLDPVRERMGQLADSDPVNRTDFDRNGLRVKEVALGLPAELERLSALPGVREQIEEPMQTIFAFFNLSDR